MQDIPLIRIGHLNITDHLVLGITLFREKTGDITFKHLDMEAISMNSFPQLMDALMEKTVQCAFLPIPAAMDLYGKGLDIRLLMFAHRSGSMMVKSNHIRRLSDFKDKVLLLPGLLSMQTMLSHKLFLAAGLKLGTAGEPGTDVFMEMVSPALMPEMMTLDTDRDIGGFFVPEPFATQAIHEGTAEMFLHSDRLFREHPSCALVMYRETIEKWPAAVDELIRNLVLSGHVLDTRPAHEIVTMSRSFLAQDMPIVEQVFENPSVRFTPSKLVPDNHLLNMIQEYLVRHTGMLKTGINMDQFALADFAQKAAMEYYN